jgi:hypothetical protein
VNGVCCGNVPAIVLAYAPSALRVGVKNRWLEDAIQLQQSHNLTGEHLHQADLQSDMFAFYSRLLSLPDLQARKYRNSPASKKAHGTNPN